MNIFPVSRLEYIEPKIVKQHNGAWRITEPDWTQEGEIHQAIALERKNTYEFMMTIWNGNSAQMIDLEITDHLSQKAIEKTGALLSGTTESNPPHFSSTKAIIDRNGLYDVSMISCVHGVNTELSQAGIKHDLQFNVNPYYAWDARLIRMQAIWSIPQRKLNKLI